MLCALCNEKGEIPGVALKILGKAAMKRESSISRITVFLLGGDTVTVGKELTWK